MAHYKGDADYTWRVDEVSDMNTSESEEECDTLPTRWLDAHYDVLQEFYWIFLDVGRRVFGNDFYTDGGFHTIVAHVHEHTF